MDARGTVIKRKRYHFLLCFNAWINLSDKLERPRLTDLKKQSAGSEQQK
jgi:hypothetical protein